MFVPGEEGLHQGAPLSCFLCTVAGKRAQLAAEAAMDQHHGVARYAGTTDQEKAAAFTAAAAHGGVGGYLDDMALQS